MEKDGKLITPTREFQNEFNDLLKLIAEFMNKAQEKKFKLSINAKLELDFKTLTGQLYKPLIDVHSTDFFEKKEVNDGSI
jgi:chemotaxis regulatin CheY-phosphate phosphatase CheZ